MQRRDEDTRGMREDEEEEGGGNREVKGGKQHDIIQKIQKSIAVNRRVHGGKQNERTLKFEK